MKVWIKRGLFLLVGLVLLGVMGVAALLLLFDPNHWKPQIQTAAAKQGVKLDMRGDIRWQWFPSLGLRLGETTVDIAPPDARAEQPLVYFSEARVAIALRPLLDRQLVIEEVTLLQPRLYLAVNSAGSNNFTPPDTPDLATPTTAEATSGEPLPQITVSQFAIEDAQLTYIDELSDSETQLRGVHLTVQDFNDQGNPFQLTAKANVQLPGLDQAITLAASGALTLNNAVQLLTWQDGELIASASNSGTGAALQADFGLSANYQAAVAVTGQLALSPTNAAQWLTALGQSLPDMNNPNALNQVSLNVGFDSNEQRVTLSPLKFTLDKTTLSGNSVLYFATESPAKPLSVELTLAIDQLNLDDYLAPADSSTGVASASPADAAPTATAAVAPEEPLPLELLNALDAKADITLQQLQVSGLQFTDIITQLQGKNGVWNLSRFSAKGYDGSIAATAKVFAENQQAVADAKLDITTLSLLPLLQSLADISDIEGSLDGTITGQTRGSTATQLFERSTAKLNFTSPRLRLNGMNLEEYYCKVAAQVDQAENLPTTWAPHTDINNTTVSINWADQQAVIQQLTAEAVNLRVAATGSLQWPTQTFAARFPLQLLQQNTSPNGCLITSNFFQQRDIDVVRCKGTLDNLDLANQCGIDNSDVTDLAKQALRYNAQKKIDPKKKELREELKEKLNEKLSDDKKDIGAQFLKEFLK